MKKILALIFAVLILLPCFACSSNDSAQKGDDYLDLTEMSNTRVGGYLWEG